MKGVKLLEAAVGVGLIASGGVTFLATTVPGVIILADAFGVKY